MKILIAAQTYAPQREGGAELVARRAAEALSGSHDVQVLSIVGKSSPPIPQPPSSQPPSGQPPSGPPVHRFTYQSETLPGVGKLPLGPLQKLVWHARNAGGGVQAREIEAFLETARPDVIYAHNIVAMQPQLGRVAARMQIPIVQHLHDYAYLCPRTSMFKAGHNCAQHCTYCRMLTAQWRQAASRSVSDVVAVSAFVANRLRDAGAMPKARWHVLHNVEPAERLVDYRPTSRPKGAVFTFGFLGAIAPEKGIEQLVRAFLALPDGVARLIIGGRGDPAFMGRLQDMTRAAAVEWRGHVDPNSLLGETDALVVPSLWHEPQALVVTEGVNRGLVVIGSDRGGNTEILSAYAHGLLFDPDHPSALKDVMAQAMASRRKPQVADVDAARAANSAYFQRLEDILKAAAGKS